MSLSLQILDIYDDIGKTLLREVVFSAPDFVKTAQIASREDVAKLSTDGVAIAILTKEGSRLRKFPTHTPQDTWLSCAYFEKNAHKLPEKAAKIAAYFLKEACAKHGVTIPSSLKDLVTESYTNNTYSEDDHMSKTASVAKIDDTAGADYALNGRYPLFNEGYIKQASAYFSNYCGQFTPQERRQFATNLVKKAFELDVELPESETALLNKTAGANYGDKLDLQIKLRKDLVDGIAKAEQSLDKVASAKSQVTPDKFAALLSAWDAEVGLSGSYSGNIRDPYESTFSTNTKEAGYLWEDATSGMSLSGKELEKAASESFDKIKGYFGETLANSLKKHGSQIFESLPTDAKTVIARIAKGSM